jgi:ribonucleoside-diphosphate reductase beta chain
VWDSFDRRQKAKAEGADNDGAGTAGEGGDGPDMFEVSGVAAE